MSPKSPDIVIATGEEETKDSLRKQNRHINAEAVDEYVAIVVQAGSVTR